MSEFKTKMNENGRIVIPAACRRMLNLAVGDELIIHVDNNELRLTSLKQSLNKAKALVHKHAKHASLVGSLKKMRQEDIDK